MSAPPTRDWVLRRINGAAAAPAGAAARGDHDLTPGARPPQALTAAAVLVPLIDHAGGMTVLLTQRTDTLANHAGQISFPGGHEEKSDASPEDAALREAEEEIGLARRRVEVIGRLDTYITRTGFRVTPVVGLVTPPLALALDPREVADAFEVPLPFFLDPANHQRHSRDFRGSARTFYAMPYGEYFIWGATAGMLFNLYEVLGRP